MTHTTKQLLLVTFCYTTAGNGASFRTHGNGRKRTDGWTDRDGSHNSYLDTVYILTTYHKSNHIDHQLGNADNLFELYHH